MERSRPWLERVQDRAKRPGNRVVIVPNGTRASILIFGSIDDDASRLIELSIHDLIKDGISEIRVDLANADRIEPLGADRFKRSLSMAKELGGRAVFVALSETIARQLRRAGIVGHVELEEPFAS